MPGDGDWFRFIPAGAGNTNCCWISFLTRTVYPRSRGELPIKQAQTSVTGGLSPLARGIRETQQTCDAQSRFIPASAGNTRREILAGSANAVYPRWRGEHISDENANSTVRGLSPLARGTPAPGWLRTAMDRFIPAGAGNTPAAKAE